MINQSIQYLKHDEIDKSKWDNTVAESINGFIYFNTFFLDTLCKWDALILGNYDYIMPLPYKTKKGFTYIYTPQFIGQLGIVSKNTFTDNLCLDFINAIPVKFSYVDIQLNEYNMLTQTKKIKTTQRINFVLPLNKIYVDIEKEFTKDAKKNLCQCNQYKLSIKADTSLKNVFDLYQDAYHKVRKNTYQIDYNKFYQVCEKALALNMGFVIGIKDEKENLVAAGFFGLDNKRIYYLLGAPSTEGRKYNATHFLINEVIKKYANTYYSFDFEGSDIPSVANFYKKFNPMAKSYINIILNRLPFFLKWFKK
jgi:hypothetical protein